MQQLESNIEFNIQNQIDNWIKKMKSEKTFEVADSKELRSRFLDLIDQFKEKGLDDEEAFWVASKRMGGGVDLGEESNEINNPVMQIRISALILGGVMIYFFAYHFIEFTARLLFAGSVYEGVNAFKAINWVTSYLYASHILVILIFTSIYFLEKKVISFIENVNFKPRDAILLLVATFLIACLNVSALPIIKNLLNKDSNILSPFYKPFIYFDYTFPFIVCVGFVLIYFKYYKSAKF